MAHEERKTKADPFGLQRVLDDIKVLPQAAYKLDNSLPIFSNEVLISVEKLNIDAASFVQMESEVSGDEKKISEIILKNIKTRGKQHNAVTGSGGMLIGTLIQKGSHYQGSLKDVEVGSKVATLVSLTLTPLFIEEIVLVSKKTHQVSVRGHAILFESGIAAEVPKDISENVTLAVLDVAGAPALTDRECKKGDTVIILGGGGKAGLLSCVAAYNKIKPTGTLIAIESYPLAIKELKSLKVCDHILELDATDSLSIYSSLKKLTYDKMGDVVINLVSVPNTEMASVLAANDKAKVLFFSMATQFTKAALGAEGVGSKATLIIGNGYVPNHASFALNLIRANTPLRDIFTKRYL